jgi:tRNA 2-thiouridine synthesizing protein A
MREADEGEILMAIADDPDAPREIGAVAAERGWHVDSCESPLGPALSLRQIA